MSGGEGVSEDFDFRVKAEQQLFQSPGVAGFFAEWCNVNDSIVPQVIPRNQWWGPTHPEGILGEVRVDGKRAMWIPEDLHLWEMIDVIEAVDRDTFATNPEKAKLATEKMRAVGETFRIAGIYLAQRTEGITDGLGIARSLAHDFYDYGNAYITGKKEKWSSSLSEIASHELSEEQVEKVERYLAGETLYQARKAKAERAIVQSEIEYTSTLSQLPVTLEARIESIIDSFRPKARREELRRTKAEQALSAAQTRAIEVREAERLNTLKQFFRVADKAFKLQEGQGSGDTIHEVFTAKIRRSLREQIELPKHELPRSIFRRGTEFLRTKMPPDVYSLAVKQFHHWENGVPTLHEALEIDKLKLQLAEVRLKGDAEEIASTERAFTSMIQIAISRYAAIDNADNPSKMILSGEINCVGASTLAGVLMQEVGINYLVGNVPRHSILFLVTATGEVEWRDMLNHPVTGTVKPLTLTNEMIRGGNEDGTPLTISDIVAFSQSPQPGGLLFDIESNVYQKQLPHVEPGERKYVQLHESEYGQYLSLLNNTAIRLDSQKRYNEALVAFREILEINPNSAPAFTGIGTALYHLRYYEEAITSLKKSIEINDVGFYPHLVIGNALFASKQYEDAAIQYKQALVRFPDNSTLWYNLGIAYENLPGITMNSVKDNMYDRLHAYTQYLLLARKEKDADPTLIRAAETKSQALKRRLYA